MESNIPTDKTKPKPKGKLVILAVIILVSVLAISVTYAMIATNTDLSNGGNKENSSDQTVTTNTPTPSSTASSWMTKGAYATYEGQVEVMSIAISFEARMEIIALNSTHAQVATTYNIATPYGSEENSTTFWVNKAEANFKPDDLDMNNTYHTQVSLSNIGTRDCTVYEYSNGDITAAYYVDSELNWPVRVVMSSPVVNGQSYSMDLSLKDTNIPGL